jgi:hypothetical protein
MDIIELLKQTQEETLRYYKLPAHELELSYAPGKWTNRELLCHLADTETVLYERIRRVIAEPKQVIWAFDQDLWAKHLEYKSFPLSISKSIFKSVRNGVIHLAEKHYFMDGDKEFIHSETGQRTLKKEFENIVKHNQHHLNQIQSTLSF